MDWINLAEKLPTGQKTRSKCPANCGDGNTLIINHNIKGFSCHCFRCDFNDFVGKGQQTLAEISRVNELNESASKIHLKVELPNDYTTDIPLHGRLWLYKGGISESVWREAKIGYSPQLDRVILPVYDNNNKLVWFQCRALLKGQKPKYMQPAASRESVLYRSGITSDLSQAIIVEDILSAIRVGKHKPTFSLLGTKITTAQAVQLSKYRSVSMWLDPDKAGVSGSYSIKKTLGLLTDVRTISTDKDPKELSDVEIKQILEIT